MSQIAIIGLPSKLGGADTELDHQINIWQDLGIEVHVVHACDFDANAKKTVKSLEQRGVIVHEPRDWKAIKGIPAISYCSGPALEAIEEIREQSGKFLWANCMSWIFPKEKEAHEKGLIDAFIYQTKRVMDDHGPKHGDNWNGYLVRPYFDSSGFIYRGHMKHDGRPKEFRFCHVSRADADKYHPATRWLFETMVAPVPKAGTILGWSPKIENKLGKLPNWIETIPEGTRNPRGIFAASHALIHFADPCQTENLPRVGMEAMASGCVILADARGGWLEEVRHGETGFLAHDQREMVYYASRLAYEPGERRLMADQAHEHLSTLYGREAARESWQKFFSAVL